MSERTDDGKEMEDEQPFGLLLLENNNDISKKVVLLLLSRSILQGNAGINNPPHVATIRQSHFTESPFASQPSHPYSSSQIVDRTPTSPGLV